MELEKLFLKKEELPILNGNFFQIPIHPKLLTNEVKIDETIANKVFPKAAQEWYGDLKKYVKTLKDESIKEWINNICATITQLCLP